MSASSQGVMVSAAGGRPILSQQYLKQHVVGTPGKDVIWQPLRDALVYPSAGGTSFSFLATPIGGGVTSSPGAGAGTKTIDDTNLDLQGILGTGNEFYQIGLEFAFDPGIGGGNAAPQVPIGGQVAPTSLGNFWNDVFAVGSGGVVTEKIGTNREYIQDGPLSLFPPATHLVGTAAVGVLTPTTQATAYAEQISYAAWGGESYVIVPLYITGTQKFTLKLEYENAIPTISGVPGRLRCRARGYNIRQVT